MRLLLGFAPTGEKNPGMPESSGSSTTWTCGEQCPGQQPIEAPRRSTGERGAFLMQCVRGWLADWLAGKMGGRVRGRRERRDRRRGVARPVNWSSRSVGGEWRAHGAQRSLVASVGEGEEVAGARIVVLELEDFDDDGEELVAEVGLVEAVEKAEERGAEILELFGVEAPGGLVG